MSKPIVLTQSKWYNLRERLKKDHSPSVMLVRTKMKNVLGFTVREHAEWVNVPGHPMSKSHTFFPLVERKEYIHLDFYSEPKRTMFLLKYSEYLDKTGITDS
jgi:hypothetical protein